MAEERQALLDYFHRELRYLRHAGVQFAQKHPNVARHLDLRQLGESADPHVERLLESFAFIAARLSRDIDDRLPLISAALLESLYPHLITPLPSVAIAQFQVESMEGQLTTGYPIRRGTLLNSYADEGMAVKFQTSQDLTLLPLKLLEASWVSKDLYTFSQPVTSGHFLSLKIHCPTMPLSQLGAKEIRFFIHADRAMAYFIYQALFAQDRPQIALGRDAQAMVLPFARLEEVGFGPQETLLPGFQSVHPASALVQEYFHFPEKFFFFQLTPLIFSGDDQTVDLLISVDSRMNLDKHAVSAENFLLGCTPVVNLFPKITDPVRLDQRHTEYRLIPDQRQEKTLEIHSIQKVMSVKNSSGEERVLAPYFSSNHDDLEADRRAYWFARRDTIHGGELPGTEMVLSFVDSEFNPHVLADEVVYAYTLCTNRYLATEVPSGGKLEPEESMPISQIVCLHRPIAQRHTPKDGDTMWKLLSQLSLNHLSLSQGVDVLKDAIRLLAGDQHYQHVDLDVIKDMTLSSVVTRIGHEGWRGFVRGMRVRLQIYETFQTGASVFLLSRVLQQYLAMNVQMNSFLELEISGFPNDEVLKRWAPQSGYQKLI